MKKRVLFSILSLVLVIGCETYGELDMETSDQVLGGGSYGDIVDNPFWDWVDAYPGLVGASLPRLDDVEVTIKGGYEKFEFDETIFPLQSTGYYAAPSEIIYIDVPANAPSNIYLKIGLAHKLFDEQYRYRYGDVTSSILLEPGQTMSLLSYFGGFVYLYYDHDAGPIPSSDYTFTLSNVIQGMNYTYGETSDGDWRQSVMSAVTDDALIDESSELVDVEVLLPWVELISDRIIITTTLESVQAMDVYPSQLMHTWNTVIETRANFFGSSSAKDESNQMPLRLYTDLQVPWELQLTSSYSAFPHVWAEEYPAVVVSNNNLYENRILDVETLLDDPEGAWYKWVSTYYSPISCAFADVYKNWWAVDNVTSILELPIKYLSQYYNTAVNNEGVTPYIGIDFVAGYDDMVLGLEPESLLPKSTDYTRYTSGLPATSQRALMFAQLMHYSDWLLFNHIGKRSIEVDWENIIVEGRDDIDNFDFFAMCAAEYTNRNLLPFFNWWRLPISSMAGEYIAQYDDLEKDFVDEDGYACYFFEVPITDNELFISEIELDNGIPAIAKEFPVYEPELYIYDLVRMDVIKEVSTYINHYHNTAFYVEDDNTSELYYEGPHTYISDQSEGDGLYNLFDGRITTSYDFAEDLNANRDEYYTEDYTGTIMGEIDAAATDIPEVEILLTTDLTFNSLAFYTSGVNRAARIYDIKYLTLEENMETGDVDSVWVATYPNEFIVTTTNDDLIDMANFYQDYTSSGISFKVLPDGSVNAAASSIRSVGFCELYPAFYGNPADADPAATYITYSSLSTF